MSGRRTLIAEVEDGVVQDVREDGEGRTLSVEEMAEAEANRDGWQHVDIAVVKGKGKQASFEIDHRKVTKDGDLLVSSVEAKLPRIHVEGQWQPGDKVKLEVEFLVEELRFPPIKENGVRIGTERKHVAEVVRVRQPKRSDG